MHECHVGLYSLHTQYNYMHAHGGIQLEADENIPTWHSCNDVDPMHKLLDTSRFNSLHV